MIRPEGSEADTGFTSLDDWLATGRRVSFDLRTKKIVAQKSDTTVHVFERVVAPSRGAAASSRWVTLLPGFPNGSYGYANMDRLLNDSTRGITLPLLYVEYLGQGDSDKPSKYDYSTFERADLVEALWQNHDVKSTVVVAYDFSCTVLLELLQRQKERFGKGICYPHIEHVLAINGGLFADGHSRPLSTTSLLKTKVVGQMGASLAQRSNLVMSSMLKPLWGKDYRIRSGSKVTQRELRETARTIRLRKGASTLLSQAAGFAREHQQNANRWNLHNIYVDFCKDRGITFHIVGSADDPFEHKQVDLARKRLGDYYPSVKFDVIPGGHLATSEQAAELVGMIRSLLHKSRNGQVNSTTRPWTSIAQPITAASSPSWTSTPGQADVLPAWSTVGHSYSGY